MPIIQDPRPYDPTQDPGNPRTTPPHWSVIVGMLVTILSAGVASLIGTYQLLKTEPGLAILMAVAAMLAAAGTLLGVAFAQSKKETAQIQGATEVTIARIEAPKQAGAAGETQPPSPAPPRYPACGPTVGPQGGP